jgi:TRAP-type C4-dicarboxylate transport system substrate-binding protein
VILSNKMYEVQKYVSATNHVYAANIILVGKKFWDKLTPTEQKILQDAAIEARDYQRVVSRDVAGKALAELKAKGMQVNELSPAESARMRQMVKPIHDKFAGEYDPALVKLFHAELDRINSL